MSFFLRTGTHTVHFIHYNIQTEIKSSKRLHGSRIQEEFLWKRIVTLANIP